MPDQNTNATKKFSGDQEKWNRLADALARSHAPTIYACKKCGYPVAKGYSCSYCHDMNPYEA